MAAAARWSAGLRYTPWNIRSLVHPLLLVYPVQKAGELLGLTGPRGLTVLACLPTIAFSTVAILVLYRVARTSGLGERTSAIAAFLYAFHWMPLTYGSTPYPRPISTCLLLLAFLLLQRDPGRAAPAFAAGLLAAGAFAVRWSEGAFLIVLAGYAAATSRRPRAVLALLAGACTGALALVGGFDALTRGSAFESLRAFLEFHRDQAANGSHVRAWFWYGSMLPQWVGPLLIVLLILAWPRAESRVWMAIAAAFAVIDGEGLAAGPPRIRLRSRTVSRRRLDHLLSARRQHRKDPIDVEPGRSGAGAKRPVTRPRIGLRAFDESGPNGVEVNVSKQCQQVVFPLDEERPKAPLEQMADAVVPAVEALAVVRVQREDDSRQRHRPPLESQVDVISHEAVAVEAKVEAALAFRQAVQVGPAVPVVEEDWLALVPPRDDVVNAPVKVQPERAGHRDTSNEELSRPERPGAKRINARLTPSELFLRR